MCVEDGQENLSHVERCLQTWFRIDKTVFQCTRFSDFQFFDWKFQKKYWRRIFGYFIRIFLGSRTSNPSFPMWKVIISLIFIKWFRYQMVVIKTCILYSCMQRTLKKNSKFLKKILNWFFTWTLNHLKSKYFVFYFPLISRSTNIYIFTPLFHTLCFCRAKLIYFIMF